MQDLTIHGFAQSTYTRSARMAAEEKEARHTLVPLAFGKPEHFALHPFGKMPVLKHGAIRVFETLAIIAYLDHTFGTPRLFGSIAQEKAAVLSAASAAIDYAYRPVVHAEVTDGMPDPDDAAAANRVLDWLETGLGRTRFAATDEFSAADLIIAPMVDHHTGKLGDAATFAKRPKLRSWMAEMRRRPSFIASAS